MAAVFTVLIVLTISLIVVRVATVGLTMTGVSKDLAHFQALSAFTGSGFTTRESEEIVNHPLRRRIVMHLMQLGNAGIVIAVASVMLSFLNTGSSSHWSASWQVRMSVLFVGIVLLWLAATSRHVEEVTWQVNSWAIRRWMHLDVQDYTRLLRLSHDYVVWEMQVKPENWLAGLTLAETDLADEGILVLGIERSSGKYIGAPRGSAKVEPNDQLILYGPQDALVELDERQPGIVGNLHHVMAVTRQIDVLAEAQSDDSPANGSPPG